MDHETLRSLLALTENESRPNLNPLGEAVRNNKVLALNVKTLGYELARMLGGERLKPGGPRETVGLGSKASTQADLESRWLAHWCAELRMTLMYHRKIWELAYVLQALHEHGCLAAGKRGLGFGCGVEPIPSYLAAQDVAVTVTDMAPDDRRVAGWASSNEHLSALEQSFHGHLVGREMFEKNVELRYVDMNTIPDTLRGYDFCWSICALEHLGSIRKGLDFIVNAMATLRPGGIAVHTTEYNFWNDAETIDNWTTVLFQKKHFIDITATLRAEGHDVADLDLSPGTEILDRFIDIPPFAHDLTPELTSFAHAVPHLKVSVDGFPATCFGIIIRRKNN